VRTKLLPFPSRWSLIGNVLEFLSPTFSFRREKKMKIVPPLYVFPSLFHHIRSPPLFLLDREVFFIFSAHNHSRTHMVDAPSSPRRQWRTFSSPLSLAAPRKSTAPRFFPLPPYLTALNSPDFPMSLPCFSPESVRILFSQSLLAPHLDRPKASVFSLFFFPWPLLEEGWSNSSPISFSMKVDTPPEAIRFSLSHQYFKERRICLFPSCDPPPLYQRGQVSHDILIFPPSPPPKVELTRELPFFELPFH